MDKEQEKKLWIEGVNTLGQRGAPGALGIEVIDVDDDSLTLTMPITDAARQPFGLLHGGVSMVLAETAASVHASWGIDISEKFPVGIEINGSHLSSASEGTVQAVATVTRRARSLIVHTIEITHIETGRLLCTSRVTNYYKRHQQ